MGKEEQKEKIRAYYRNYRKKNHERLKLQAIKRKVNPKTEEQILKEKAYQKEYQKKYRQKRKDNGQQTPHPAM